MFRTSYNIKIFYEQCFFLKWHTISFVINLMSKNMICIPDSSYLNSNKLVPCLNIFTRNAID